jgi:hypothetical protein
MGEQIPYDLLQGTVMRVDQQWATLFIRFPPMSGEVNLLDGRERIGVDIAERI